MKLAESGLNSNQFIQFVSMLSAPSYDEPVSNYEEGIVYLNDTDYIEADEVMIEGEVEDGGKYQDVQSVYKYVDAEGNVVYLKDSYSRSGSYFTDWYCTDYKLEVVNAHKTVIVEYY